MSEPPHQGYEFLDPDKIEATIGVLRHRIQERFPDSGLRKTSDRLLDIARHAKERSEWIARPLVGLRLASGALIVLIVLAIGLTMVLAASTIGSVTIVDLIQTIEAGIADIVYVGAAIFFLVTLEGRIKRRRALAAVHELRSVAHIIDMLQLTKDPERARQLGPSTASTPPLTMTAFELTRYLDYCSEMLSLTGKIAALYVQNFSDSVALAAVNEVETLATSLSRKIWQKIMIIHSYKTSGGNHPFTTVETDSSP